MSKHKESKEIKEIRKSMRMNLRKWLELCYKMDIINKGKYLHLLKSFKFKTGGGQMTIQNQVKEVIDQRLDASRVQKKCFAEQSKCVIDGNSLYNEVLERMKGSNRKPTDRTVMRRLRDLRHMGYTITCIDNRRSIYAVEGKNGR